MWRQVARIYIGGATEPEIEDKRLRYEDAINALKGGIAEGMVPGGGACYAYMLRYADEARALFREGSEEVVAVDVLCEAMSTPCKQIASKYAAGAREPGRARASPDERVRARPLLTGPSSGPFVCTARVSLGR